jgi:ABC-2 type transport system ATP-binding protein
MGRHAVSRPGRSTLNTTLLVDEVAKTYLPPPDLLRPLIRVASREPVTALRAVSLDVQPGEVVGLVGPNGAGKTTLIKIVASLLAPTSGSVSIAGFDVLRQRQAACRMLGLVLEGDRGLYDRLTGLQNLEFFGAMAGLRPAASRRRASELLETMELSGRDKLAFGYSAGMRMRLSIARALMADPALIVLDEPTRSLDPLASRFACRMLRRLAGEGRAVLLSNHRLDEVVTVCDRLIAIVDGEVRFQGTPGQLDASSGGRAGALTDLLEREVAANGGPG